ncbi:hypothetical protein Q0590_01720 [Rhodocytophaga aerolata]|uniref:Copper resistance protein NlpE n=1 Tax=Rhodocytophaga aerolata TaxID=455078 RepID=A0ABT8QYM9_9BACT|nr:hypothetical protein [Rhodocytophaga aerolata]MDO1444946.1 hypothetical protein [Rhodocytophaga aerolata]
MKNLVKTGGKLLAATLLSAFFASTASAQEAAAKETSLTGEVLDLSCYMKSGAKGPEHKSCATGCLKNGNPVGLLASDGKVYLVVEDHKNADPYKELITHPAEQVKLTGTLQTRNGMPGLVLSKMEMAK